MSSLDSVGVTCWDIELDTVCTIQSDTSDKVILDQGDAVRSLMTPTLWSIMTMNMADNGTWLFFISKIGTVIYKSPF